MAKKKNDDQVIRFDGKNVLFEVLTSSLAIDKVKMTFLRYDTNPSQQVDIYMEPWTAKRVAHEIMRGNTISLADSSILSGTNKEGSPILSRKFSIIQGHKMPWLIEVKEGAGRIGPTGLIIPDYGDAPVKTILVPLAESSILEFALALNTVVDLWMDCRFRPLTEEQMRVTDTRVHYVPNQHREDTDSTKEEPSAPPEPPTIKPPAPTIKRPEPVPEPPTATTAPPAPQTYEPTEEVVNTNGVIDSSRIMDIEIAESDEYLPF